MILRVQGKAQVTSNCPAKQSWADDSSEMNGFGFELGETWSLKVIDSIEYPI